MWHTFSGGLLLTGAWLATASAAIPPLSPEQLKDDATHIVSGTVKLVATEQVKDAQWLSTVGVVEIQVSKLEKGGQLAAGDSVYARFWRKEWVGKGSPPPHGSGHHIPKKGDTVRAYLVKNDGGYDAPLPNGFEVLPKPETPKGK